MLLFSLGTTFRNLYDDSEIRIKMTTRKDNKNVRLNFSAKNAYKNLKSTHRYS